MASEVLYRIQAADGRGPFRPGLSRVWSDGGPVLRPPSLVEREGWRELVEQMRASGLHCGAGCRTRQELRRWFTRAEERRLRKLGYRVVTIEPDVIFAEWPDEVTFGCRLPLREALREIVR